ncbi:MAG TPA: lytic transglycosylase domain-containing protein [Albitalea sp.]|uniref:lytic transglycosylase domain-containing protein n=1 Tax=Piscinibacter sp. TaxID=1903157 RepID=UPI002ED46B3E
MTSSNTPRSLAMLLTLAVPWHASASAGQETIRYRCTMIDGSVKDFIRDVSHDFPSGVGRCVPVTVPAAGERTAASPAVQPPAREWFGTGVTTVSASPRTLLAPASRLTDRRDTSALREMPAQLAGWVETACQRHGISPPLAAAVMYVESRYRPDARSPRGALGLMQVMPATAARYGVHSRAQLLEPRTNIDVGVRYLRDLSDMFPGRVDLAVAAYNAGEGAVLKHGRRVPPYAETERYVEQVLQLVAGAR